mmetsp:Transcript_61408/g.163365  ORF Transcript_61408/g.163365 Transcript_61408/m.163365 type:complete len:332 (+) Transcript_61408:605-1600(+)
MKGRGLRLDHVDHRTPIRDRGGISPRLLAKKVIVVCYKLALKLTEWWGVSGSRPTHQVVSCNGVSDMSERLLRHWRRSGSHACWTRSCPAVDRRGCCLCHLNGRWNWRQLQSPSLLRVHGPDLFNICGSVASGGTRIIGSIAVTRIQRVMAAGGRGGGGGQLLRHPTCLNRCWRWWRLFRKRRKDNDFSSPNIWRRDPAQTHAISRESDHGLCGSERSGSSASHIRDVKGRTKLLQNPAHFDPPAPDRVEQRCLPIDVQVVHVAVLLDEELATPGVPLPGCVVQSGLAEPVEAVRLHAQHAQSPSNCLRTAEAALSRGGEEHEVLSARVLL